MKILVTNDDGIEAPGLEALVAVARHFGEPLVVAPRQPHSGCSHRVTTQDPIHVEETAAGVFVVDGTPADCVRVALHDLLTEPAWVLAGINAGGNLGADVHLSGTVAAVREAALHRLPGVAISQYRKRGLDTDWQRASAWTRAILKEIFTLTRRAGEFWNVNLPHPETVELPQAVYCPLDSSPLPVRFRRDGLLRHYEGDYHQRSRQPGADVDVCFSGRIAITRLTLSVSG
jgi:5'-nucleotidase